MQVEANLEQHQDLFWAMRGVGSAFGIVTTMRCRLHDVSDCMGGHFVLPYTKASTNWAMHRAAGKQQCMQQAGGLASERPWHTSCHSCIRLHVTLYTSYSDHTDCLSQAAG